MFLDEAHDKLGWPRQDEIFQPSGAGAKVIAEQLEDKLGHALRRRPDGAGVRIGVLTTNPDATEAPLAIICEFPKKVSDETLALAHKLAWNFGRASLLLTIEPHILRTWTCCEPPLRTEAGRLLETSTPEIPLSIELDSQSGAFSSNQAAASLHWVELLTGEFFRQHDARFKPEKRADQKLLSNLRDVRQRLLIMGLDDDTSHVLLARIIFIQFLFDRKDPKGKAALDGEELRRLHEQERVLAGLYTDFADLLGNYDDTYALFRRLNTKFNGDLFPGKGNEQEQQAAWAAEQQQVKPEHLALLARFVKGDERMSDGQLSLWPDYAFDAIPLDLISTIYEQFVKKDSGVGVHYTPSHVADLILDSVLPWQGEEWDLKVLDPSCGSGVFLVKAYQRLIYRWKNAHPDQSVPAEVLKQLLEENIFGVDKDPHAVRVASFSLYLAMCDEIDPRDYWKVVHFPPLRQHRLIAEDFFCENHDGFRTANGPAYDLVVGNPPWGKNTATHLARIWQKEYKWPISYGDIGPLFAAKALALTKAGGYIGLIQPASTFLYKRTEAAQQARERLFSQVAVEEVINLAALRFVMFHDAVDPACVIIARNIPPDGKPLWYMCPKPYRSQEDNYRIIIEPQDVHQVYIDEAQQAIWLWCTLMWGGQRDATLMERLVPLSNLAKLEAKKIIKVREGIIPTSHGKEDRTLLGKPLLRASDFPTDDTIIIQADNLLKNTNPHTHRPVDTVAFSLPQLIIKQSWLAEEGRFHAALVDSTEELGGILCTQSFLTVHADPVLLFHLQAACLVLNSSVAVYFLLLASGRFAMYRPEPQTEDFRSVPIPELQANPLNGIANVGQVDERVREAFKFTEAEWTLVEDLAQYTLPDFKGDANSPGRLATNRRAYKAEATTQEPELTRYCETFCRVLKATYGDDKKIGVAIYSEPTGEQNLPVRMVSIFLNDSEISTVHVEPMHSMQLRDRLAMLYKNMLSTEENKRQYYQRCARTYETVYSASGQVGIRINLIKPDQIRYWTRSTAMRDADEVAADMMLWNVSMQGQQSQEAFIA